MLLYFLRRSFMSPRLSLSPPAGFAKVTGRPSYLVLSSSGCHFCEILVPHVPNNGCRYPRELFLCIVGFECVVCRQSDNVRIHEIPQRNTAKWSLYSLPPFSSTSFYCRHLEDGIWGGGWEKELSAEGYNLISLLALSSNRLSLGAQIGV